MSEAATSETDVIALVFDKPKQLIVLGHALVDEAFFSKLNRAIKPEYFSDPLVSKIWSGCSKFLAQHRRKPTVSEITLWEGWKDLDSLNKRKLEETINNAVTGAVGYGKDVTESEIDTWMSGVHFVKAVKDSVELYKKGQLTKAWQLLDNSITGNKGSSFAKGVEIGFKPSSIRILEEKAERVAQKDLVSPYGVQFLDDALIGIMPTDLIVLGASSGSGKSAMAAAIALANASRGKRVHYFALEAKNNEIEQRIKYGILATSYYKSNPNKPLSYPEWMTCQTDGIDHILDRLEDSLQQKFVDSVKNMQTLYRTSGDFTVANLNRYLLQIAPVTDLIIVDHLHYLDIEDGGENEVYADCIKSIRDIVLNYSIPVIVIAHLRKKQTGRGPDRIIPAMDDFHGTSNISKIATTCVMLAPAWNETASSPLGHLLPTYLQIVKSRMDGSRTKYGALMEFNIRTNMYERRYKLGKYINNFTEFEPLQIVPKWANVNG